MKIFLMILSLLLLACSILFAISVVYLNFTEDSSSPCSTYSDISLRYLPARCLKVYLKK